MIHTNAESLPRWETFELALAGPEGGNPFTDVTLSATFRKGGRTVAVRGFYDGGGLYRVRFLADTEGTWTFTTASNAPVLHGRSGQVTVTPAPAHRHGPVRVSRRYHFAHEDGTPYLPFGTTCYAWTHQGEALEQRTLATLKASPFNKMRMCVFPKHYDYNTNDPELFPFERANDGWNWNRLAPAFFRHLEQRLIDLDEAGIEADLILFHPYDRWGFSTMDAATDDFYLTYVVARLSALPNVWWSLANEYDLMKSKTTTDWERFAKLILENDPSEHLRSIHNCILFYDYTRSWITHVSLQRVDVYKTSEAVGEWRERWQKPVVVDECAYEGDINWGWGNITGQDMVRRFWEGTIRGGYVGHGETYLNDREELWWSKGGELVGSSPERIGFLRRLVEADAPGGLNAVPMGPAYWDVPVGGRVGEYYLFYFGWFQPRFRVIDLPDLDFVIDVIDTWAMRVTPVPGRHRGTVRVELPGRQYMAIRARLAP